MRYPMMIGAFGFAYYIGT